MAQYGAGPELAAQCPRVPPPGGWQPWTDASGPIPDALAQRAQAIANDQSVPLGATESYPLPGVTTLIRVEPQAWGRDAQDNLISGCFRTGAIFLPDSLGAVTPPTAGIDKTVGVLTAISLAVGTAVTLATWGKK